jgi:energy-coupling factor transport system permease protein
MCLEEGGPSEAQGWGAVSFSIVAALRYRSLDTAIHRLDPRVKLLISASFLINALLFNEYFCGMGIVASIIVASQLSLLSIAKSHRSLLMTMRGAIPLIAIVYVLNSLGGWAEGIPLEEQLYRATASSARFLAFITSFSLFFLTTSPDEFGLLLFKLRVPYTYAFVFVAAVRLAPILAEEVQDIVDAQRSRGRELEGRNPIRILRGVVSIFTPLLINSLRRAYEMAEALEVKCFGASQKRTSYRELRMRRTDYAVMLVTIASEVLVLYLRALGVLNGLP